MSTDNKCAERGNRYQTSEERREAYLISQRRYANKRWRCDVCDCEINNSAKSKHMKSKKHRENQEKVNKLRKDNQCLTCSESDDSD
jgi:hypothetical protein